MTQRFTRERNRSGKINNEETCLFHRKMWKWQCEGWGTNTSHFLPLLRGFVSIDIPKRRGEEGGGEGGAEFLGFRSASFRAANLTLATFRPICHEWKSSCSPNNSPARNNHSFGHVQSTWWTWPKLPVANTFYPQVLEKPFEPVLLERNTGGWNR